MRPHAHRHCAERNFIGLIGLTAKVKDVIAADDEITAAASSVSDIG